MVRPGPCWALGASPSKAEAGHAGTVPLRNQHKLSLTQPFREASLAQKQSQILVLSVSTSVTSKKSQLRGLPHQSHKHTNYLVIKLVNSFLFRVEDRNSKSL